MFDLPGLKSVQPMKADKVAGMNALKKAHMLGDNIYGRLPRIYLGILWLVL